MKVVEGMRAGQ